MLVPASGMRVARIDLEFASFSDGPQTDGGAVGFGRGQVTRFATTGLGTCAPGELGPAYRSPTGAFRSVIRCSRNGVAPARAIRLGWTIDYRTGRR
jgi:hypothetical protein